MGFQAEGKEVYVGAITCPWCGSSILRPKPSLSGVYTCSECGTKHRPTSTVFQIPERSLDMKNKNRDKYIADPAEALDDTVQKGTGQKESYKGASSGTEQGDAFKESKKRGRL
jgi:DNA-directed RNA polymerase subunit RPC12/RpoP